MTGGADAFFGGSKPPPYDSTPHFVILSVPEGSHHPKSSFFYKKGISLFCIFTAKKCCIMKQSVL